jgi:opacity protein-like surface antigen
MRTINIIALSTLALISASAYAMTAQSGVYVGAVAGWSIPNTPSASEAQTDFGASTTTDNKNYTWGGTLGYDYALNRNMLVGAEASYINFGKTSYSYNSSSYDWSSSGIQLMLTGSYLLNNGFNAFAKVGAIDLKDSANAYSFGGTNFNNDNKRWRAAAEIGAGYMINQNTNVTLQYERAFGHNYNSWNSTSDDPATQNAITAGVTYKFMM